jgi:nucleoside-diphosphate-sugar epimerase
MTTLVIGATSQIGHVLLPQLLDGADPVVALSRRGRPAQGAAVAWQAGSLPAQAPALDGITRIYSFGPLDALAEWLARQPRLEARVRLVATSSMSAESKRHSPVAAERAVAQRLRDGEARLVEQCGRLDIAWTILRPTLIYGAARDRSLTPIARAAARWRVFPLPRGRGLRQPVHAADVALAAQAALQRPDAAGQVVPLGGGERLDVTALYQRIRASLPVATLPVPIPAAALRAAAWLPSPLRGPLQRLQADLVADNGLAERVLGIAPRPFHPDAATWGLDAR